MARLLRDKVEQINMTFGSAWIPFWTKLNCTDQSWTMTIVCRNSFIPVHKNAPYTWNQCRYKMNITRWLTSFMLLTVLSKINANTTGWPKLLGRQLNTDTRIQGGLFSPRHIKMNTGLCSGDEPFRYEQYIMNTKSTYK